MTELVEFCYSYVVLIMYNVESSCISCMINIRFFKIVDDMFTFFKSGDLLHESYIG